MCCLNIVHSVFEVKKTAAIYELGEMLCIQQGPHFLAVAKQLSSENKPMEQYVKIESKINIETRRSTTLKQRVILVQGPC
jgi:hypothetical protein